MEEKSKYCCEEHIDIAFDDYLEEYETFPYMEENVVEKCTYCENKARYVLTERKQ